MSQQRKITSVKRSDLTPKSMDNSRMYSLEGKAKSLTKRNWACLTSKERKVGPTKWESKYDTQRMTAFKRLNGIH